jgi:membrane protease subunit HflC
VVDVDLAKVYLPTQNMDSVFERMKAERGRIAAQFRSEGERDARVLIAQADAERVRLLAAAAEQSERLRAEGEAQATRIYAEAYGQAPELYQFLRTLEAYRSFLDDATTLFLPADAEIFDLLQFDVPLSNREPGAPDRPSKPDELAAQSTGAAPPVEGAIGPLPQPKAEP